MNFRKIAAETLRIAGQELIDCAEEMVPNTDQLEALNVWIRISPTELPEIQVSADISPRYPAIQRISNALSKENTEYE